MHQYHPYTINNFVQCGKIDNKIVSVWGPLAKTEKYTVEWMILQFLKTFLTLLWYVIRTLLIFIWLFTNLNISVMQWVQFKQQFNIMVVDEIGVVLWRTFVSSPFATLLMNHKNFKDTIVPAGSSASINRRSLFDQLATVTSSHYP